MSTLLQTLYGYHAWANVDLFNKLESVDAEKHDNELQTALRLISHYYVVSRIFAGHLQGVPHGFTSDNLEETPALHDLKAAVTISDQWYLDYLHKASLATLSEPVAFTFTDGDKGYMTREEMLTHVALHGGYHRARWAALSGSFPLLRRGIRSPSTFTRASRLGGSRALSNLFRPKGQAHVNIVASVRKTPQNAEDDS